VAGQAKFQNPNFREYSKSNNQEKRAWPMGSRVVGEGVYFSID
jgi:hypothetical protein